MSQVATESTDKATTPVLTTYSVTLEVQNDWNTDTALQGVWVAYQSGSNPVVYIDCLESFSLGVAVPIGNISPRSGNRDYWTITFLDSNNQLWGTEQFTRYNLDNQDGTVQIDIENNNIQLILQGGTTKTLDITRL